MTAEIASAQDSTQALRLLIAQRKLYSKAKFWTFLRWLGFSAIGAIAPPVAVFLPSAAVVVGAFAGVWIFLSRTVFQAFERNLAAKGAAAQEDFDRLIFAMPVLAVRDPRPSPEEIAEYAGPEPQVLATATKEKLIGWYPLDSELDGVTSIAIAQRANAAYSERLQRLNARCWVTVLVAWAAAAVILSLAIHVELSTFLLGVAAPLLPAFLDVTDQWRSAKQASGDRRSMADDIEQSIRGSGPNLLSNDDLLVWQERLYGLRRSSPLVPNLVYKRAREKNEQTMNAAAAELSSFMKRRIDDAGTENHP
ncbi:hypothetical protein H7J86_01590 [Mycobacterium hackensackense]|uniref:S-4TM family putative pore-forming effector n=1 Tax=Mycobacterium hackensackense TaxID=228909 RepID=UPI002265B7A2|nr:S-4TM family putative pore-forming effector [Mycobacterium hackensackense]MCV7250848.1 hypothetical protein [Mycobacterium hackensackense]